MTVTVERVNSNPVLIARHYDVEGNLTNEDLIEWKSKSAASFHTI